MTGIERLRKLAEIHRGNGSTFMANYLSDIADQMERERDAEVADSPYDAILPEDRNAAAWVREHGGLNIVRKLLDWVVGHCSTKQQLDFDFWLSGRVMYELGFGEDMADREEVERRLLARLMPKGIEWPRYESGELVRIGDVVNDVEVRSVVFRDGGILLSDCTSVPGWGTWRSYKEPIKLTHTKPEIDTWERIEEDKDLNPFDYCKKVGHKLWTFDNAEEFKASDLVRRCRALAERERGE